MSLSSRMKAAIDARLSRGDPTEQALAELRVKSPGLRSPKQVAANKAFEAEIAKREAELRQQAQPQPG